MPNVRRQPVKTVSRIPVGLPLEQHIAFQSGDFDELNSFLDSGGVLERRKLTLLTSDSRVNAHLSAARLNRLHLMGVHLGADVIARSVPLNVAQIMIPLCGQLLDRTRGEPVVARCGTSAIVHMPETPVDVQWQADTSALVVRIPVAYFKGVYRALTGEEFPQQVQLQPCIDLRDTTGKRLYQIAKNLVAAVSGASPGMQNARLVELWEELLVATLLTAESSISRRITSRKQGQPMYGYVKRITGHILNNITESLSVGELAREAGVSVRTLQNGFRKSLDVSPMAFARQEKLDCVYRELLGSTSSELKIARVAARWGFHHASHFTRVYKQRFKELPSETLARKPGSAAAPGAKSGHNTG